MVAAVPGDTAVMKRSAKAFGAACTARSNMSHSRSASPRSSYRTGPTAWGASPIRAASARLLAVVADVDAGFQLTTHDLPHRRLRLARERGLVHRLATILLNEQCAQD